MFYTETKIALGIRIGPPIRCIVSAQICSTLGLTKYPNPPAPNITQFRAGR